MRDLAVLLIVFLHVHVYCCLECVFGTPSCWSVNLVVSVIVFTCVKRNCHIFQRVHTLLSLSLFPPLGFTRVQTHLGQYNLFSEFNLFPIGLELHYFIPLL